MNVEFAYMYRDGGNYKREGSVVFAEAPEDMDRAAEVLASCLDQKEYFIAHQVGVPELFLWDPEATYDPDDESTYPADLGPGKYCISNVDHSWHEFTGLSLTDAEAIDQRTWSQFLKQFQAAHSDGWKIFEPGSERPPVVLIGRGEGNGKEAVSAG